jgi:NodT family efflux transporter outer membrane factor (OMF) lipoprotein
MTIRSKNLSSAIKRGLKGLPAASLALLAAGCAVGPNFVRPAAPSVRRYTEQPLPASTASADVAGGNAQRFLIGADIPAQWWRLFRSKPLDALIEEALASSPTLRAAQAALTRAKESYLASVGSFFPSLSGNLQAQRQKSSGALSGTPRAPGALYNLYYAQAQVSYVADVFGGVRRQVEESGAAVDFQRDELEAAYLTLTANVVTTTVNIASLASQLQAAKEIADVDAKIVEIVRRQVAVGAAAPPELLQQQAQLAQAQAAIPPLRKQIDQAQNLLAALTGRFPSQSPPVDISLDDLRLPSDLPLSVPSRLVEQRPDVRAATAQLHEASAAIGVATANMLPQITLTADIGTAASTTGALFSTGNGVWSIAGGLLQPIFKGGTLLHEKRAAVAAYEQAAAQYRSTVLTAFQNVADALRALTNDADALKAQRKAERTARHSLDISERQYAIGAIAYPTLLQAVLTYQQARSALAEARGARFADTAALFQALGGGWWNRPPMLAGSSQASAEGQKVATAAQLKTGATE